MFIEDPLARQFYIEMARIEHWDTRTLADKIDLLFFHRGLRRIVAIDLKLGKFKPEYEGQMLLYLRYLNKNERREGEENPIKVAQYYTKLPDKKLLSKKLQRAIAIAKEHYAEQRMEKGDECTFAPHLQTKN